MRSLGFSVALIGLPYNNKIAFGEALNPDIKSYLLFLDIWHDFIKDNHLKSFGNLSAWGNNKIKENNFFFHPNTYGYHIDRQRFNKMFIWAAKKQGAQYLSPLNKTIDKDNNIFKLKLIDNNNLKIIIDCKFMIDATGRSRWFSLREDVSVKTFDHLCGYICFLKSQSKSDTQLMTLIESVSNGWWYTALLPNEIRVAAFFTDYDLSFSKYLKTISGWKKVLNKTQHIRKIIDEYDYNIYLGPYAILSNSTRLEKAYGQNWLAIGDAAATFDPLSSNGVLNAIDDGIIVSNIIKKYLEEEKILFESYNSYLIRKFNGYLYKRSLYYNKEKRWGNSFFWKRNQNLLINIDEKSMDYSNV
jgi:flavin-dependent dehydrogenase